MTIVALTKVCQGTRGVALPIVWSYVYVETMKDWCILWKRISAESGQHIRAFVTFWAIARLPPFAMDKIESRGKNMLWYAFFDRKEEILYDEHEENIADRLVKVWRDSRCKELGCGSDGYG